MRNNEYTCDRCGAQFDAGNGCALNLGPIISTRSSIRDDARAAISTLARARYDLCPTCADAVRDQLARIFGRSEEVDG